MALHEVSMSAGLHTSFQLGCFTGRWHKRITISNNRLLELESVLFWLWVHEKCAGGVKMHMGALDAETFTRTVNG